MMTGDGESGGGVTMSQTRVCENGLDVYFFAGEWGGELVSQLYPMWGFQLLYLNLFPFRIKAHPMIWRMLYSILTIYLYFLFLFFFGLFAWGKGKGKPARQRYLKSCLRDKLLSCFDGFTYLTFALFFHW